MRAGRRIHIEGVVQGVGFRPWIYRLATAQRVGGRVCNDATGVTIDVFGAEDALARFVQQLKHPPVAAEIRALTDTPIADAGDVTFQIADTQTADAIKISIPADLATCPECVSEMFDSLNRRFRYPFTNCTNCGPRFTICAEAPYDRHATTMAAFRMCSQCQREYDDPLNRRFHAQPNACPECGPRLTLCDGNGLPLKAADPVRTAAAALRGGWIVAIKGLGGFHLACDATSSAAVRRLRQRKHRDEKPLAVMVADIERAGTIAALTDDDLFLLTSAARPIVLVPRRATAALAPEIAPRNPLVGVMLPYTPLHHLLMHDVNTPLVMTSGNLAEEPIACTNDDAFERLGEIADLFLVHDREIVTRCDDSVARVIAGAPVVLRRSRGYVPQPIVVAPGFSHPVLACGALLKNTFCVGVGDSAFLGPHVGDLEHLETYASYEASIARMLEFLRVRPEVVAYDLHPDYLSTRYALEQTDTRHIGVQHHHAHIASGMAEHGLTGPVIGVAYDGTGYGTDGTAWGGEIMVADYRSFERLATVRPIALPGADAAIREPWRIALALLDDVFGSSAPLDAFPVFAARPLREVTTIRQMIAHRLQSPLAHGVGRYFDGIAALVLGRSQSRFEGQLAMEWNAIADPDVHDSYGHDIDRTGCPWTIDLRQMVADIVRDLLVGVPASAVSARFHNTLALATVDAVRGILRDCGKLPIILTGGCFQNARLAESIASQLTPLTATYLHNQVPPGDGGIALGQAVIANAIAAV